MVDIGAEGFDEGDPSSGTQESSRFLDKAAEKMVDSLLLINRRMAERPAFNGNVESAVIVKRRQTAGVEGEGLDTV